MPTVRSAIAALLVLAAASATASAQKPGETPRARREKILIRIDSLRYEFDHLPLSAEESESLRIEMGAAMASLEPGFAFGFDSEMFASGYLGVTFDGPSVELPRPGERVIRFLDYPRVSMVEPGSPAERGGVLQGDTLVSLNGTDVKNREISLTRMLVPQRRLMVRVRRQGRPRDLRVMVDTSPEYMARRMVPMPPAAAIAAMPALPPTPAAVGYQMPRAAPQAPAASAPVLLGEPGVVWDIEGVAGARLETVTEGLGKALGVRGGVLVLRAAPGTPAYRSGLREGDIILRANGQSVANVRDVRRAVAAAESADGVRLLLRREGRERQLTLWW